MSAAVASADVVTAVEQSEARLQMLLAQNAEFDRREWLYRTPAEETDALSMRSPLNAQQAYGMLGLALGAIPPATYFMTMFGHQLRSSPGLGVMLIVMNAVCAFAGYKMGKVFGPQMHKYERSSWSQMILMSALIGLCWGLVTGFFGGLPMFGIGGLAGAMFAAPVGLAAFPAFAVIHRLIERGSMVERNLALPATFGLALIIGAFILSFAR